MPSAGAQRAGNLAQRYRKLQEKYWRLEENFAARGAALQQSRKQIATLQEQLEEAHQHIAQLKAQQQELANALTPAASASCPVRELPPFIKANTPQQEKKKPGQKAGHKATYRLIPTKVDVQVEVPAPVDRFGKPSCPTCYVQLSEVKTHKRYVEDLGPPELITTCYTTTSGYCPGCRTRVETRHEQQPPAPAGVDLPQSQLGLNALSTAVVLRMVYRLPFRQIKALFLDLPGLSMSASGVARQIQRIADWLEGEYDRLNVLVTGAQVLHADETSWRVDGQNQWLWLLKSNLATLYHINKSRGQKVAKKLIGENFTGTLVSDFYSGYEKLGCRKQKCLAHLDRELKETSQRAPLFAAGLFYPRCRRLVKEMFLLKRKQGTLEQGVYEGRVRKLERRLLELARGSPGATPWQEKESRRLAKRVMKHREELTRFLWEEGLEGTNNAAERALRSAVVMRKITGGSRSEAGARATAVLMSVLKTAQQHHLPLIETTQTLLKAHWSGKKTAALADLFRKPK